MKAIKQGRWPRYAVNHDNPQSDLDDSEYEPYVAPNKSASLLQAACLCRWNRFSTACFMGTQLHGAGKKMSKRVNTVIRNKVCV
jgi:hypothetical protein